MEKDKHAVLELEGGKFVVRWVAFASGTLQKESSAVDVISVLGCDTDLAESRCLFDNGSVKNWEIKCGIMFG